MRNSDLSAHSEGEIQPLKKWFQDTYSREYLTHPHQSSFEFASMSFHSPFKSAGRVDYSNTPRRRFRATSLSPRYLSPIANRSGAPFDEEFVMGCSVCGTKAIEDAMWTYHDSPPRMRPSNRPELVDMDQENSGAYSKIISCRLHRAYSYLADAVNMKEIKLLEGKADPEQDPFAVQIETNGATAQTTVVKEVFPAPAVPLTPLNYEESNRLKESLFHNSLAEKYVKEEERLRVATRRAEYANRVKGFSRVVESTKLKNGEMDEVSERLGFREPEYNRDSLDVFQVEHRGSSSGSDAQKELALAVSEGSEPHEEKKKEAVRVKAPSSFRNSQRHNTASVRSEKEAPPVRSPAAESEEMTESTGKPTNSELARKKLEEIKKTVKQRREERKSREIKQGSPGGESRTGFPGREGGRHPTGGSTKDLVKAKDSDVLPSRQKAHSVTESVGLKSTPREMTEKRNAEERKSAVIGAVRLHTEEQASSGQGSEEEEGLTPPQPVEKDATPLLPDEDVNLKSEENRESISPIPPIESFLRVGEEEKPADSNAGIGVFEEEKEGAGAVFESEEEEKAVTASQKLSAALLHTPQAVPESAPEEEEGSPLATRPTAGFKQTTGQKLFSSKPPTPSITSPRQVLETGIKSKPETPNPPVSARKHSEQDVLEEQKVPKKGKSQTDLPSSQVKSISSHSPRPRETSPSGPGKPPSRRDSKRSEVSPSGQGKPSSSRSPRPMETSPQSHPHHPASKTSGGKGKSAEGTPERSPVLSPRAATERTAELGFGTRTGVGGMRVGESQWTDSKASSARGGVKSEVQPLEKPTQIKSGSVGKSLPKQQGRKKLSSGKVSKIAAFHQLQEEAAVLIQRATRSFLGKVSRNKSSQCNSDQYRRMQVGSRQEILELLEDDDVLAGLRILGGFVEYLEERGLREM